MNFGKMSPLMQEHEGGGLTGGASPLVKAFVDSLLDADTEHARVWGEFREIDGKKYLVRPSMRLGTNGQLEEFMQRIPVLSLEVNGETIEILGLPMETMALTPDQHEMFEEAGGLEVDCSLIDEFEQMEFAENHQNVPIDWQVNFENFKTKIHGTFYTGFALFKKVYEAFPDIQRMTQDEATAVGLYPIIHYRNNPALKWMTEMNDGRLTRIDDDNSGELDDIFEAITGETWKKKVAAMGQALFGIREANQAVVSGIGQSVNIASGFDHSYFDAINAFAVDEYFDPSYFDCKRMDAVSGVVVLNKKPLL